MSGTAWVLKFQIDTESTVKFIDGGVCEPDEEKVKDYVAEQVQLFLQKLEKDTGGLLWSLGIMKGDVYT